MLFVLIAMPAGIGILYTLFAASLVRGRRAAEPRVPGDAPSVTILKPLHGVEPRLRENLTSFLNQDYPAPVQMLCGVGDPRDSAVPVVADLQTAGLSIDLVVGTIRHGTNGKVSTLINMTPHVSGDLLVLSDSDMAVAPDYLRRIAGAIGEPGVGAVTCLYAGRGDAGGWSRLAAAWISWSFLPSVMVGLALGLAKPCMGSTIALRRETLARIGGFAPFADLLADDHAIGAAVRVAGLRVAIPPMITIHGCAETSLHALAAHELRWHRTVRLLDPAGHVGSIVTHPLPLAMLTTLVDWRKGLALVGMSLAARLLLALRIDRLAGGRTASLLWLPLRDLLSFGLFLGSFLVQRVDWRGQRLGVVADGRMTGERGVKA